MTVTTFTSARIKLGLSSCWESGDDRDAVMKANKRAFRRLKERYGARSLEDIPGFCESIQRLYDYGYSLTDIGAFVGVSKQRVHQWFQKYDGLEKVGDEPCGALFRLWDDDLNCFVPVTEDELIAAANQRSEAELTRRREEARRNDVKTLKRIAKKLGRVPRVGDDEVIEALGYPAAHARRWGVPETSYVEAHDRLWAAAGFPHRPGREWELNGRNSNGGGPRALTEAEAAEVRLRHRRGESKASLSRAFDVHWNTIHKVIRREGAYSTQEAA